MKAQMRNDLLSALALLTRAPLPPHQPRGAASAWAWPLVGAGIGGIGALVIYFGQLCGLSPGPLAALVLAVMAMCSGGLHEDGLADTADGLLGGQSAARRLEIMKDSRIGSYGTLALLLVTLGLWSALGALIAAGTAIPALIAASALSRAPMAVLMTALPSARPAASGLSAGLGRPPVAAAGLAVALGLLIALLLLGAAALPALLLAALVTAWLGRAAVQRIGGQTGDILGASQQLSLVAMLILLA